MALHYILELPCEPKRRFGAERLFTVLRINASLDEITPRTPEQATAESEMRFQLEPLSVHCRDCPANHQSERFGCWGWVELPVSAAAERWLALHLPQRLKPGRKSSDESKAQMEATGRLVADLQAEGILGARIDASRALGAFDRRRPLIRAWGPPWRRRRLSTSQIFELLFYRERITPAAAELLLKSLGLWRERQGVDDLLEVVFTAPVESGDDPSVAELKSMLLALVHACSLDVSTATALELDDGEVEIPS